MSYSQSQNCPPHRQLPSTSPQNFHNVTQQIPHYPTHNHSSNYLAAQSQAQQSATTPKMDPNEYEAFQNMSDHYNPDLPGPLISAKQPISALVSEYAQADPRFVAKTTSLQQTHQNYRTIKGDGQCGWRSTVFGYFELLLNSGDYGLVQQEHVRVMTFEDTIKSVGLDYDIMAEMFEFTWELFAAIEKAVQNNIKDDNVVLNFMNDKNKSDTIVYHFKMMTSAYMQLHEQNYEPFLMPMTVQEYRLSRIDPTNQEIDEIGLQALSDAVISPADITLQVLYLDRSDGNQVTPHLLGKPGPMMLSLLYRPGHYDIIYQQPQHQQNLQVYLMNQQHVPERVENAYNPTMHSDVASFLGGGPSFHEPPLDSWGGMSFGQHDTAHNHYIPQQSMGYDSSYLFSAPAPQPFNMMPQQYPMAMPPSAIPPVSMPLQQNFHTPTQAVPSPASTSRSSPPRANSMAVPNEPQIRMTELMYRPGASYQLQYQHHNSTAAQTANHFRNAEFQPHMWNPDEEYTNGR